MVGHILVEYDTPFSDNPKIQDVGFLYAYRLVNKQFAIENGDL